MAVKGVIIGGSSLIGSSAGAAVFWAGGRTALVVNGLAYGGTGGLQMQIQGPSGAWLAIGSSIIGDQVYAFDAPAGQYRMVENASSSIGINAILTSIPYIG